MKLGRTNKEYKDRLFKFIFGNPENREWTLELYNAVNGTNYDNADDIKYNTIDDAIYMNMKNDVSFIIENEMSLYEQQSTYCPNMPLRFLMYLAKLYEAYAQREGFRIHSSTTQKIPRPKCVCFYNGVNKKEDRKILRLSDMYFKEEDMKKIDNEIDGIVELEVVMLNINYGHNKELLERCKPLYEYSFFVDKIRTYMERLKQEGIDYTLEKVIDRVIDELPKEFKILKFIRKNRMEVKDMCLFEYDQERHMREEREEGREEGRIRLLVKFVNEGILTVEKASEEAGMTAGEFEKMLKG